MRFNSVEVDLAYADYLDSLDDWPIPESEPCNVVFSALSSEDNNERSPLTVIRESGA